MDCFVTSNECKEKKCSPKKSPRKLHHIMAILHGSQNILLHIALSTRVCVSGCFQARARKRKHFLTQWGSSWWSLLSPEAVQADNVSRLRKEFNIFMGSKAINTDVKGQGRDGLLGVPHPPARDAG